ncbi:Uma2 family endonuclease [Clostridium sp. C2-6-12]|uniref:Uma2 family endonuclease n=1 Tax=Clostridium sp. C2-6-12 TaxID=2698832 RepID=UPI00136D0107|nr:Uma2 family endonuclease [Clostridium sp. C2-6-12]
MHAINNIVYTYADYLTFTENGPVEIIEGRISAMSPAPSRVHQKIISKIITELNNYITSNNGQCEVYPAPFDVILVNDDEEVNNSKNIVQPYISLICNKDKLNDKGCIGAPDMIIEVVSPYNPNNDYIKKLNLYDTYKVKEYWIVNPMKNTILVYTLEDDNGYGMPSTYTFKDKVKVNIYDDFEIDFNLFDL